jgi:hypothetical protein
MAKHEQNNSNEFWKRVALLGGIVVGLAFLDF